MNLPGAIAPADGGIAHTGLAEKARVLRHHWRRVVTPAEPGDSAGPGSPAARR